MADSGTCKFAFTFWVYYSEPDSLGRLNLAKSGTDFFALSLGMQQFSLEYNGVSLINKVIF